MEKAVNKYVLSQEEINKIASIASQEAVKVFKEQQKKEEKKREKNPEYIKQTKKMLRGYRAVKSRLVNNNFELSFLEQRALRVEYLEDLMGVRPTSKVECILDDIEKNKKKDQYAVTIIDKAMELYKKECEATPGEEAIRRYREVYAMHIAYKPSTVLEIAEKEGVSDKTVYNDLKIAYNAIAVYMFGL